MKNLEKMEEKLKEDYTKSVIIVRECKKCGECCRDVQIFIVITEAKRISLYTRKKYHEFCIINKELPIPRIEMKKIKKERAECIFLKNNECLIHKVKPFQCFSYPVLLLPIPLNVEKVKINDETYYVFKCKRDGMEVLIKEKDFVKLIEKRKEVLAKHYVEHIVDLFLFEKEIENEN